MTEFEKEDFWKGLGRLYDASVNLVTATERLRVTAEAHEKRLDMLEVVQQWLAEKEREREKGQS
jgi:IS5 family transposase